MKELEDFLEVYSSLERDVQQLMSRLFSETCGLCTACCCRADICEEAVGSAFLLRLLHHQGVGVKDLDERYGWLEQSGCSLEYGRPPVCYAYFCDQLLARLPDDETRYVARMLGRLMEYIGENALNGWHLTEIMNETDLGEVDYDELLLRLKQSRQAYQVIEQFVQTGRLSSSDCAVLNSIPMAQS